LPIEHDHASQARGLAQHRVVALRISHVVMETQPERYARTRRAAALADLSDRLGLPNDPQAGLLGEPELAASDPSAPELRACRNGHFASLQVEPGPCAEIILLNGVTSPSTHPPAPQAGPVAGLTDEEVAWLNGDSPSHTATA
jgi:hypothetical protein